MALPVSQVKKALRKEIMAKLKSIPGDVFREQGALTAKTLMATQEFEACEHLACFLSVPNLHELDTWPIVRKGLELGKKVYVPRVSPDRHDRSMHMYRVYSEHDLVSLPRNSWNIPEPEPTVSTTVVQDITGHPTSTDEVQRELFTQDTPPHLPSLLVVPGLAFDREGIRLGRGGGYYDRYMLLAKERLSQLSLIAVAVPEQVLDTGSIPTTETDLRVPSLIVGSERFDNPV